MQGRAGWAALLRRLRIADDPYLYQQGIPPLPLLLMQLGAKALEALATGGWLTPRAVVVLEESAGVTVHIPDKFVEFDRRTYGDTQVILARYDANTEGST